MKVTDRIWMVGSGKFGFQLSDSMDCNVYALDCGDQFVLIDAGGGVDPEWIVGNARAHGVDFANVSHVLLTHLHGDHAAGAQYWHSRYGVKVVAAKEGAPWLESGDMDKTSLNPAKRAGVYPADFHYPSCPVHRPVEHLDVLEIGNVQLRVLETPGHSRGHVSYLWEESEGKRTLFSGDAIFAGGKIVIQHIWDCSIPEYAQTIEQLSRLTIDRLCAGHGAFLLNEAWRHVEQAKRYFDRLEIPPNL